MSLSRLPSNWWCVPAPEQHTDLRSIHPMNEFDLTGGTEVNCKLPGSTELASVKADHMIYHDMQRILKDIRRSGLVCISVPLLPNITLLSTGREL